MNSLSNIAEGFPRRQDDFHALPFHRLNAGGFGSEGKSWPDYPKERLAVLLGLDRLIEVGVDSINISFGYYNEVFEEGEPIQIATKAAADLGIPVVVAAGNHGPREDSLQVLARAPWVIAVGATDDKGRLLRSSSRGVRNGIGPTVVSAGTTLSRRRGVWGFIEDFMSRSKGTSFAAPRVSPIAAVTKRCLEIMATNFKEQRTGDWKKHPNIVRLITVGIADSGVIETQVKPSEDAETMWQQGSMKLFSRSGREWHWYNALRNTLESLGIDVDPSVDISIVRRALRQMARSLKNYQEHEVGGGYLEVPDCISFFRAMLPSRWLHLFSPTHARGIPQTTLTGLDEELGPLWEPEIANSLTNMLLGSLRMWFVRIVGTNKELECL